MQGFLPWIGNLPIQPYAQVHLQAAKSARRHTNGIRPEAPGGKGFGTSQGMTIMSCRVRTLALHAIYANAENDVYSCHGGGTNLLNVVICLQVCSTNDDLQRQTTIEEKSKHSSTWPSHASDATVLSLNNGFAKYWVVLSFRQFSAFTPSWALIFGS